MKIGLYLLLVSCMLTAPLVHADDIQIFAKQQFTNQDAVLVSDQDGHIIYTWRADQLLIPASLTKLLTSYLAIEKWGLSYRFKTDFYQIGTQLWVKGFGDPYLVSEELDRIVAELNKLDLNQIQSIHIDASYFVAESVPGRSSVADPYNAPVSAVSANFNTAYLQKVSDKFISAEMQTPLTETAQKLVSFNQPSLGSGKKVRLNLVDGNNAQTNFAEILAFKLGFPSATIHINQALPQLARPLYRHFNSHSLESVLTGAMKYSNNFIANQLFLKLAEQTNTNTLNFASSQAYIEQNLQTKFAWQGAKIVEGAGLSRDNALSAQQIDEMLVLLKPYKHIFKQITATNDSKVFAKTGTLTGVSNYAGYIDLPQQQYRFVFMFNRATPYGYRDQKLALLVKQLSMLEAK